MSAENPAFDARVNREYSSFSILPFGSLRMFLFCFESIWQVHLINSLVSMKIIEETIIIYKQGQIMYVYVAKEIKYWD